MALERVRHLHLTCDVGDLLVACCLLRQLRATTSSAGPQRCVAHRALGGGAMYILAHLFRRLELALVDAFARIHLARVLVLHATIR